MSFSLAWVAGKMLCRSQSSLFFCEEEGCLASQAALVRHTHPIWAALLPCIDAGYRFVPGTPTGGTFLGGSGRSLLAHCLESEAAHPNDEWQGRKPFPLPAK